MITKGEEIQILIYRLLDPHLFLSQHSTILSFNQTTSFLFFSTVCSKPIFFFDNSILPFLKYASFFVQFYSTIHSNPIFFCHNSICESRQRWTKGGEIFFLFLCLNPNLLFLKYASFSVQLLVPYRFFAILFYRLLKPHLFLS